MPENTATEAVTFAVAPMMDGEDLFHISVSDLMACASNVHFPIAGRRTVARFTVLFREKNAGVKRTPYSRLQCGVLGRLHVLGVMLLEAFCAGARSQLRPHAPVYGGLPGSR